MKPAVDLDAPWRKKAREWVDVLCREAYAEALRTAKKKRRVRVDYRVPDDAEALIVCLNKHHEEEAKAIMLRLNGEYLMRGEADDHQ